MGIRNAIESVVLPAVFVAVLVVACQILEKEFNGDAVGGVSIASIVGYVLGCSWCRVIAKTTTQSQHRKEMKNARLEAGQLRTQRDHLEEETQQLQAQLSPVSSELEAEIADSPLDQRKVRERVKRLDCFFGLSKLVNRPQTSLDQVFEEMTELIRNAYRHPDTTCVRITLDGIQYKTDNFHRSELSQYVQINVRNQKAGSIEVYNLGEPYSSGQEPFLEEERDFIETIAEHLGRITERKQTGEKLELFRNLIDQSNDCIFLMEPEWGRFLDINEKACENLGYTREELLSMAIRDIEDSIPDNPSWREYIKELRLKREIVKESKHRRKDGTAFSVETSLKYVCQEKGSYVIAVARDIDDRKKAEEEIRRRQELLTCIISNIPHCVFWKDRQSTYLGCNENFGRIAGVGASVNIAGKTDYDLAWKKDEADWFVICDREVMDRGRPLLNIEESQLQSDGKEATILSSRVPLKNKDGSVIGLLGIYADITERKQAEEALELACGELERANRELKETQSQLVQSEKLASIGQLAAGVAHEMNTPVGFVTSNFQTLENYINRFRNLLKMYADLVEQIEYVGERTLVDKARDINRSRGDMKMDFVLEDVQELFDESKEGLRRVTGIIQNLRDFSRIDQPEDFAEYNLNEGIEATLGVANNEIKHNCSITTTFSAVPSAFCNSGEINQVFLNILLNAAQAIKSQERDDEGIVAIRTYSTETQVVCEISDDGPGIPPGNISKIFDPFFTTRPVGQGTGLGLSVSYDIVVNKHKGQLLVDSTVGKGTKFTIMLPIDLENSSKKREE